ncbi:hypothetical protein Tco_1068363 [Tanacetum coccineum]|uniref:Retrotransposon gag domain-containing protein n=1 Tax=Tanacetum coccineum TaxID=301880 RepID=A0ABQ5HFP5_9ASTR
MKYLIQSPSQKPYRLTNTHLPEQSSESEDNDWQNPDEAQDGFPRDQKGKIAKGHRKSSRKKKHYIYGRRAWLVESTGVVGDKWSWLDEDWNLYCGVRESVERVSLKYLSYDGIGWFWRGGTILWMTPEECYDVLRLMGLLHHLELQDPSNEYLGVYSRCLTGGGTEVDEESTHTTHTTSHTMGPYKPADAFLSQAAMERMICDRVAQAIEDPEKKRSVLVNYLKDHLVLMIPTRELPPRTEIQKMEQELWNLTLKGDDIETYINRFHELSLMCPELVPTENERESRIIQSFPEGIKGNNLHQTTSSFACMGPVNSRLEL